MHAFVELLYHSAEMAWPIMDSLAKDELVVDKFLMGIDGHELNIQVAAHEHRCVEDVL